MAGKREKINKDIGAVLKEEFNSMGESESTN